MKTIVIYNSQTGFTRRYAQWIAEAAGADCLELSAAKKKRQLMTAIRSLAAMPFRFPLFQETDEICLPLNKYRKMFVENWYLVLYCVEDDTVSVEYILDCRQEEYQWLLE